MLWELLRLVPNSDIVHLHGFSTKNVLVTAVAKVLQRPVVLSLHTSGHDEAETIRRHGSLAWWAFSRADSYLSVSPSLLDAYLAAGLPPDRIHLVPNGIDLQRFSPADASARVALRAALGLPQELPIVLFVGFFSRDKQPRVLFDAWQRTRERHDSMLVFVGATRSAYFEVDDDLAGGMQDDARRGGFGDRVCFAGPSERVEDYFRAADVFALPSRREGLPVALLEAMACELPCVASRLPGSTDTIIDDGANGLLVPPGDVAAFAAAVDRILSAPSFGAALGANARATVVSRFANVDVAVLWLDAYDRLGVTRA
jgi:glycosyltransferase involved in cell wall biosynthesis